MHLVPVGRSQEAIAEYERALQEDPLNLVGRFQLGFCLQAAGMAAQAAMEFRRVLGLDESFWLAAHGLSMTSALEGRLPEAIEFAEKAYVSAPWSTNTAGALAGVLKLRGDTFEPRKSLENLGMAGPVGLPLGLSSNFQSFSRSHLSRVSTTQPGTISAMTRFSPLSASTEWEKVGRLWTRSRQNNVLIRTRISLVRLEKVTAR